MIDRFRGGGVCVLVLILQLVLSPIATIAAAEMQVGGAEPKPAPSKDFAQPDLSGQNIPPQALDGLPDSLPAKKVGGFQQIADGFVMPGKQNLAELFGMSEIPVLADVDGQYVKSLAENQILEEEPAIRVGETNLLDSIIAGRSFSRDSQAAQARKEQAEAQTDQALAQLMPVVSVRASYGEETSKPGSELDQVTQELVDSDTHTRTDASLIVRQPLYNLPNFLDWRRRKVKAQARYEEYRTSDGDAYVSTINTYLALVSSRLQADITSEFEKELAKLLNYIEKRAGAGAASVSDMSRVRARSQETLSSRLEQESAHLAAGIEFVRLTNLVPQKVILPVPEDAGVSLLPISFEEAVAAAMESNPEIAALKAELQAAKIHQSAAMVSVFSPTVDAEYTDTLAIGAGGETDAEGDPSRQRDRRIMAVLNWDIFSSGRDYKFYIERKARHKELQYRLDDQRRRVVQELSANYAALASTRGRIDSGYKELESISTATEAMSKRMLSANQSLLDLLTVYDRYHQVRSRLVNLHILEMNTVAQLVRLTIGTPWAVTEEVPPGDEREKTPSLVDDSFWGEYSW